MNQESTNNNNHIVLVTGATGAIGKAIARNIAAMPGYSVTLLGRNKQKTQQATEEIKRTTGNPNVSYEIADLSRRSSIYDLAARWNGRLHVLINNAGTTPRRRLETPEGIEMQLATNVLGYFWMTEAFSEHLKQSAPARVINVASYWAGGLDINDLEFKRRHYDNNQAYRQSKQANRMLTVAFAEKLNPFGITVNACHPGDVNSTLSNDLGFGGHESPDQGARTPVLLATGPIGGQETGKYFEHMRQSRDKFAGDKKAIEELYAACRQY